MIKTFIEATPGATWGELRGLLDRNYSEVIDPVVAMRRVTNIEQQIDEGIEEFRYRLISLYEKAFPGENNNQIKEKKLVNIFTSGLHNVEAQRMIHRQEPQTLEEAVRLARHEVSIVSKTTKTGSHEPMEIDYHRRRVGIEAVQRSRGRGRGRGSNRTWQSYSQPSSVTCWYCGRPGHLQRQCQAFRGN